MLNAIFVYGTLRSGEKNHSLLEGSHCIAQQAWIEGQLFKTDSYYPAAIKGEGLVYGELYEISNDVLKRCDELEDYTGNPEVDLYDRELVSVQTDTRAYDAYLYTFSDRKQNILGSKINYQDWKVHQLLENEDNYLYFAYGSCMDHDRFQKAKIDHCFQDLLGRGVLAGYSLRFTRKGELGGAADIVELGGVVEGKVYRVNKEGLDYLLIREGVEGGLYRPAVVSCEIDGKRVDNVLTFIVFQKDEETMPTDIYAGEILRGGKGTLSQTYLDQLQDKLEKVFKMIFR